MNILSGRLLGTIFSLIGCGALFWPGLAPAAPRILFVARGESANGTYELYTMSADGSDRRRVTTNTFSEWAPALAPDNYRVAYVRDELATSNLFITSIDGMAPVRLSNTNAALCVQWAIITRCSSFHAPNPTRDRNPLSAYGESGLTAAERLSCSPILQRLVHGGAGRSACGGRPKRCI